MNDFIKLTNAQKQTVLTQCRNMMGLPEQAVEKDYWVTVMLQMIFDSELSEHLIFKGGTSLSKNGNLIERFSEDIDLAVDYTFLGIEGEPTKKKLKKLRKASSLFVKEKMTEVIKAQIEKFGLQDLLSVSVEPDGEGDSTYPEPRHIYIQYQPVAPTTLAYVKPMIVLETGARSLMEPVEEINVKSIIETTLPQIGTDVADVKIPTATPGKTFLEKVFLLHELFSVDHDELQANRRSRHLYDLEKMMDKDFAAAAIKDVELWESIRRHRELFTSSLGVDYSSDIRNRLCLVPSDKYIGDWKKDYQFMCDSMIYGEKLPFEKLVERMKELEKRFFLNPFTAKIENKMPQK